ncbi:HemK2/MTQ2 family protein methyltransferase [Hoyosella subflava]|uniref:Methyltransferase n=1 Tax=Hoyosella subflava (strain DSM 45089 / JCM 17490 / NBRC 109087 / DQS3-9A1) TaxID=443218 RepID=F6EGC0_HOYSD|nr:HemK2/MTQ2 family protein methyltransferase [Hoyosella subflava]AEF39845.1 Methyltransferase [Hoyosella subflava DQS3-9A1]
MTLELERGDDATVAQSQRSRSEHTAPLGPKVLRLPGVYRPQEDTMLLAREYLRSGLAGRGSVLDVCCGTGYLSLVAAWSGAPTITAVDTSARAVWSARANARLFKAPVNVVHSDFAALDPTRTFDVVLANPPYVPWFGADGDGPCAKWDAGADGRAIIDPLCASASRLLAPEATLLMVHSAVSDPDRTVAMLTAAGLTAAVVAREHIPFGPVMRSRAAALREAGYLLPEQTLEEIVVVRADKR